MITHEVVDVVAVWHSLVPAAGTVNVPGCMTAAVMRWRTRIRIGLVYLYDVLIDMIVMGMVEVTVMKIIHMVTVTDGRVATIDTMLMGMIPRVPFSAAAHSYLRLLSCKH